MRNKQLNFQPKSLQFIGFLATALLLLSAACGRVDAGSPEAVADAFANAYFKLADQEAAKRYTAFGATKMMDKELADVKKVRESGFNPSDAKLNVTVKRGARSERGRRVGFAYTLTYTDSNITKNASLELSKVHKEWKVVLVSLNNKPSEAAPAK